MTNNPYQRLAKVEDIAKEDIRMLALCRKSRVLTAEELQELKDGRQKWVWEVIKHNKEYQKRLRKRNKK